MGKMVCHIHKVSFEVLKYPQDRCPACLGLGLSPFVAPHSFMPEYKQCPHCLGSGVDKDTLMELIINE